MCLGYLMKWKRTIGRKEHFPHSNHHSLKGMFFNCRARRTQGVGWKNFKNSYLFSWASVCDKNFFFFFFFSELVLETLKWGSKYFVLVTFFFLNACFQIHLLIKFLYFASLVEVQSSAASFIPVLLL